MSIRKLSLTLDLDTATYTRKVTDAKGSMEAFKTQVAATSKEIETAKAAMGGSAAAAAQYVAILNRATTTKAELRASGDAFVKSLVRELDTLGLTSAELSAYDAKQLKVKGSTQALRLAIEQKKAALEAEAVATRESNLLAERAAAVEENRAAAAGAMIRSLREEIVVTTQGAQALKLQQAEALGVGTQYRKLTADLNRATEAQARENKEIQAWRANAAGASSATRAFDGEVQSLGRHATMSSRAIYEMNVLVHELSAGRTRQAVGSFSILLTSLGAAGGAVLGVTLAIGLLNAMIHPLVDAAKGFQELNNQAQQLGVSVQFLQLMGVATEMTGVKTDKMVAAMTRMDLSFARARMGSKQAKDAYDAMGISLAKNYSQQELFNAVLAGWSKMDNGPRKATVAQELFGRSGAALIPVLNQLANHMGEVTDAADKYGLINEKAVAIGVDLQHTFEHMALASKGFGNTLVQFAGPAIIDLLNGMNDGMQGLRKFIGGLGEIGDVIHGLLPIVAGFAGFFATQFVASLVLGSKAFIALGEAMVVQTALARASGVSMLGLEGVIGAVSVTAQAAAASFAELTAAMLSNPLTWLALGVGILIYDYIQWNTKARELVIAERALSDEKKRSRDLTIDLKDASKQYLDMLDKEQQKLIANTNEQLANAQAVLIASQARAQSALNDSELRNSNRMGPGHGAADPYLQKQVDENKAAVAKDQAVLDQQTKDLARIRAQKPSAPRLGSGTDGDPTKAAKNSPADKLAAEVKKMNEAIAAASAMVEDGDVVAAAQAKMLSRLTQGDLKGNSPAAGANAVLIAGHEADVLAVQKDLNTVREKGVKIAADATAAWADYSDGAAGAGKKLERFNQEQEAGLRAMMAHDSLLTVGSANYQQLRDEITKTEAAMVSYTLATIADTNAARARALAEEGGTVGSRKAGPFVKEMAQINRERAFAENEYLSGLAKAEDTQRALNALTEHQNNLIDDTIAKEKEANETKARELAGLHQDQVTKEAARHRQAMQDLQDEYDAKVKVSTPEQIRGLTDTFHAAQANETGQTVENSKSPAQKLADEWATTTDIMKAHSASWMNDFVSKVATGQESFGQFTKGILMDWVNTWIQARLAKPMQQLFDSLADAMTKLISQMNFSGIGSFLSNIIPSFFSMFHEGGIVGQATMGRAVDPGVFTGALKYHTGGIAGLQPGEVPAILKQGEGVFTQDQMKSMGGSGGGKTPNIQVNVINESGTQLSAEQGGTKFNGEQFVLDVVVANLSKRGPLRDAVNSSSK